MASIIGPLWPPKHMRPPFGLLMQVSRVKNTKFNKCDLYIIIFEKGSGIEMILEVYMVVVGVGHMEGRERTQTQPWPMTKKGHMPMELGG